MQLAKICCFLCILISGLASPVPVPDPPILDCGQYISGETCMTASNIKDKCCGWCNTTATCIILSKDGCNPTGQCPTGQDADVSIDCRDTCRKTDYVMHITLVVFFAVIGACCVCAVCVCIVPRLSGQYSACLGSDYVRIRTAGVRGSGISRLPPRYQEMNIK
jgi:hypothetical protein